MGDTRSGARAYGRLAAFARVRSKARCGPLPGGSAFRAQPQKQISAPFRRHLARVLVRRGPHAAQGNYERSRGARQGGGAISRLSLRYASLRRPICAPTLVKARPPAALLYNSPAQQNPPHCARFARCLLPPKICFCGLRAFMQSRPPSRSARFDLRARCSQAPLIHRAPERVSPTPRRQPPCPLYTSRPCNISAHPAPLSPLPPYYIAPPCPPRAACPAHPKPRAARQRRTASGAA